MAAAHDAKILHRDIKPENIIVRRDGYTADGSALVVIQSDQLDGIWLAPKANSTQATQLLRGKSEGSNGLSWTPENRILYASEINGTMEIWTMDASGNNRRQLTSGSLEDHSPEMSPDGRYIVYSSRQSADGEANIWRMDRDGRNRLQLTNGIGEYEPHFSPDSRWVFYTRWNDNRRSSVWKVSINGGQPVQLTIEGKANPSAAISPDGKLLAFYYRGDEVERKKIEIVPFDGGPLGQSVKTFDIPHTAHALKWTRDGRGLTFANSVDGVGNVWYLPCEDGPPRQITDFKSDSIRNFDWSFDGINLICTRGARHHDALLIRDFK